MDSNKRRFYRKRIWAFAYVLLVLWALFFLYQAGQTPNRLETDLGSLLPQQEASAVHRLAEGRMNKRLNQDVLIMLGSRDLDQLDAFTHTTARAWHNSQLFAEVTGQIDPDVDEVQAVLRQLPLASGDDASWQKMMANPAAQFNQQAQALVNPFAQSAALPVTEDWLGLSHLVLGNAMQNSPVFWHGQYGWLSIEQQDTTWFLLRARLPDTSGLMNAPEGLLPLIHATQAAAQAQNIELLMAGGAIFAAQNKAIGEQESQVMSVLGIALTFMLLGGLFKTGRVVVLLLPLAVGVLMGLAATIWAFGHIHILTLVVGTSLIGVLLDFPLHWLASAVVQVQWQRWHALHIASKAFLLSLVITLLGYVALLVTPLPILQQTAVFSSVALVAAFLCSLLWLPYVFNDWQIKPSKWIIGGCHKLSHGIVAIKQTAQQKKWLLPLAGGLMLIGCLKVNTEDDIRQWIALSPKWLSQAQKIGELTQSSPSGQYFLLVAESDDALLNKTEALSGQLSRLQAQTQLQGFQSLSQWVASTSSQRVRQQDVAALLQQPQAWQVFRDMGVEDALIRSYLQQLSQLPVVSIQDSLVADLATAWQDLYLGQIDKNQVAGMVTLSGVHNSEALQALSQPDSGIHFVDQRAQLNTLFAHTRDVAIVLKASSYLLAMLLLTYAFGWIRAWQVLAVPIVASLLTIAVFGYMAWTLSLFAIFGLFLVTAIGMDYAIYVSMQQMHVHERMVGVMLAAMTTMISFAILGFSATPALAGFGRSVAIGVCFSMILALALLPINGKDEK